ncbi:hypothetical protein GCM10025865_08330 [Paraoerskovia sediminicola]|uniref:GP-PDE domain-containing protein n=2 Tax=Paraoerskovia sediminicola TaxID=1138587 RepID=A0ABN6X9Q0_9CELL|nr:hypothetical protein GCM10025865_08330 [Paraoerskovia sediminicola]
MLLKSFRPDVVATVREVAPHLRRGLLVEDHDPETVARCLDLGVWTCNPDHRLLADHPELVGDLHDAGIRVMTWTPNTADDWARVTALGVDAIMTDHPERLVGWLDGRSSGADGAEPHVTGM